MKPVVYLARVDDGAGLEEQAAAIRKACEATGFPGRLAKLDMTAIKVHVGEKRNDTHVKPELILPLVKQIKKAGGQPFLTDTSTLYKGERENAIKHTLHAHAHGFSIEKTGAPFLPVDGLSGTYEIEVSVNGELNDRVRVAGDIARADALLVVSHATGHIGTGLGAAIKNVGMGLSSRSGKMRQHSAITPEVIPEKCTNCGKCRKWCPEDAILEQEAQSYIVAEKCIGCGECLAVCRFGAVKFNWGIESALLQKSMAEHAAGVLSYFKDKATFINALIDMTRDCDCISKKQKKIIPDLGIMASNDIVALDQATLDLSRESFGQDLSSAAFPTLDPLTQIIHAEKMGLGSRKYKLVEL